MKDLGLKKYAVPEVALLAILVVGLVISHAIVVSRSYIKMSAPNEVPASGFYFSMPAGPGWQTAPALKFVQNGYYLTSVLSGDGGKSTIRLTVSYLLAAGRPDVNDWLISRADQFGQRLRDDRVIEGKDVAMHAAMIRVRGQFMNVFYGIAVLPGGRCIVVELVDTADEPEWAWSILTNVARSFVFNGNPLLNEGEKVIASLRGRGLASALGGLGETDKKNYFLVDTDEQTEGFQLEMYARTDDGIMNVRAVNSSYVKKFGGRESVLQADDRFEQFLWISNALTSVGVRNSGMEVRLDVDAMMSVRLRGSRYGQTYIPGPAAVPEMFAAAVLRQMLADGTKEALIDFIDAEGQIIPSIVQFQQRQADANGVGHIAKVKYFAGAAITEEFHLDAAGQIEKIVVAGQMPYVLKRSNENTIFSEFPQWLDYIRNLDKLLKEDMPEDNKDLHRMVRNDGTII